ncbi:MAG: ABC transporter permease [Deferrisomatales bacterium]|nr:ABC transporter permease [Deferrisomatales bacterium]
MGRKAFPALLAAAVLASLLVVGLILASQVGWAGLRKPLAALGQPHVRQAVALSLGTATVATCLALCLAVPAAYGLARYRFPGAAVVDVLLDLPMVLSPVAVGVSWLLFFRTSGGQWVEEHLLRFVFEVPGIVLAQFTVALALATRVLKASYQDVDVRYEQVARFLGCTPWGAFRRVTLPLARRGLVAAFILGWARSVGEFGATVTLAGAVPGKTETVPVAIYLRLASVDVGGAVALMLLLSAIGLLALAAVRLLGGFR